MSMNLYRQLYVSYVIGMISDQTVAIDAIQRVNLEFEGISR